ncbi:damage-inducible protein DinB [Flavobacterium cyanobacteriorum]|uniref:Damage-inducible protein DinB n=1 Tax=Flavobacterium cyanobacteriorum TaxID=2022802 RepID=A0A255ZSK7_9FLAO|nr:DinB family protein [Flavobacterium cyanobacteriorum]OYQ44372.1 damage-inducible protein DinB [Flavobacterium cyanobacteriorum]
MEIITLDIVSLLQNEMEQEAKTTRRMLVRIPPEKFGWQPHPKSMTLKKLATHVAELPGWIAMALTTDELDFNDNPYVPRDVKNTGQLVDYYEESLKNGLQALAKADSAAFTDEWVLRTGNTIHSRSTRYDVMRMALSQIIHHRAQLGVYLRLLNIPIPGSYGPSADDNSF